MIVKNFLYNYFYFFHSIYEIVLLLVYLFTVIYVFQLSTIFIIYIIIMNFFFAFFLFFFNLILQIVIMNIRIIRLNMFLNGYTTIAAYSIHLFNEYKTTLRFFFRDNLYPFLKKKINLEKNEFQLATSNNATQIETASNNVATHNGEVS